MELNLILSYIAALFIGSILGLIGGGGSILAVPVLVYFLYLNPIVATAYSLFIVGVSSLVGAIKNLKKGLVDVKTAFVFAFPALIMVYITRKFIVPRLPEILFHIGTFEVTRDIGIMVFFAIIMLLASFSMILNKRKDIHSDATIVKYNYLLIILEGTVVGFITGLIGAGGGFLIIPALVLFAQLPMKKAVATSLLIIAIKSLIGFIGDVENLNIEWVFLLTFTLLSIIGMFIGIYLNKFIEGEKLKKSFGWFVFIMAIYIIVKEVTK